MTRAERLGLESGSVHRSDYAEGGLYKKRPEDDEVQHSIAISLKGLRIAAERIADAFDGTALGVDISESLAALTFQQVHRS